MKSVPCILASLAGCVVIGIPQVPAQPKPSPSPSKPRSQVANGGFEASFRRESLWYGVDSSGFLRGERQSLPVLTASGVIAAASMPISVSVADMNGDGLLDIVTMDPVGYLRIYFNSGTAQEPKFTVGELAGIYLSRIPPEYLAPASGHGLDRYKNIRYGPRVHVTDMFQTGKKDLIIGNYQGEILKLLNSGSALRPDFKQPPDVSQIVIPTTARDSKELWGNVFAPATYDWNRDGKQDLLIGEGSYSANNIHLLLNKGSGPRPAFEEGASRHVLAFGDGLEQLTPAVVDYNGDGLPDLLVSERTGRIAVYLNKGAEWKAGDPVPELPFASFVNSATGKALSLGGICTVAVGDFNGDGLFDLVAGKTNGRIALALNQGTRQEPKFETPKELKGAADGPPMRLPSGWEVDYGLHRANFLAYVTVEKPEEGAKVQPAEGKSYLRCAYEPSINKHLPAPTSYLPALSNRFDPFRLGGVDNELTDILWGAPSQFFGIRQVGRARLKTNTTYVLSMKVRGQAKDASIAIFYRGQRQIGADKVTHGGRGSVKIDRDRVIEGNSERVRFAGGVNWTEVRKEFQVKFSNKELKDLAHADIAAVQITFSLPQGGELCIDDIAITEK